MAAPKWRGPWVGKSATIAPGLQTVRLYPYGPPTVNHYARYNASPASMWGFADTWPLVDPPGWYGQGALSCGGMEEAGDTERWCTLGGPMTPLVGRNGVISAIEAGVTWAPTAEAGFGSSHLIRFFQGVLLADNPNPWTPATPPWFTDCFEMRKWNVFNGNLIVCMSDDPKAPGTDITTSTWPGTTIDPLGEDILYMNGLFLNVALGMSASTLGFQAEFNFTEIYIDVEYTQT